MHCGDAFLKTGSDKHLWIVLSDPNVDPENVLIVNLTTYDSRKESACILKSGDHCWITHDTCVNYEDAMVTTLDKLNAAKDGGALKMQTCLADNVLRKILDGVLASARISLKKADILIKQGLIDC
jgi:hypothetical protein